MANRRLLAVFTVFLFLTAPCQILASTARVCLAASVRSENRQIIENMIQKVLNRERQEDFWNIKAQLKRPIAFTLRQPRWFEFLNISEIKKIAYNRVFVKRLIDKLVKKSKADEDFRQRFFIYEKPEKLSISMLQNYARVLLGRKYMNSLSGIDIKPFSIKQFKVLAQIEGLKVEVFSEGFRFDSRPPETLRAAGGFYPRPKIPKGTITEHSSPGVGSHGRGLISVSLKPSNSFNLMIWPVLRSSTEIKKENPTFQRISESISLKELDDLRAFRTFEYRIIDFRGAKPENAFIKGEKEVVSPFILNEQIAQYREVHYAVESKKEDRTDSQLVSIEVGPWLDF